MKKQIISESRLREIISEEALRMKKRLTLENEKKALVKKLNEMYMEEEKLDEAVPGLSKLFAYFTKGVKLDGSYFAKSKNKDQVSKYPGTTKRVKEQAPQMSDAQALEVTAMLLDSNNNGAFLSGSKIVNYDPNTQIVKIVDSGGTINPNQAGGGIQPGRVTE